MGFFIPKMTIQQLNRRLGECLGICGGVHPRFKWMLATEDPYWGKKLGSRYVMAQWQPNKYSRAEWWELFGESRPYQPAGYTIHAETALDLGVTPDEKLNQNYIWALDVMMQTTEEKELIKVNGEIKARQDREYAEWVEQTQNMNYSALDNSEIVGYGTKHTAGLPLY